jgi:thiol-disulfide isomerase/thioredoxin
VWRGPLPIVGSVVVIAAVIAAFVLLSRQQSPGSGGGDAAAIVARLAAVSRTTLDTVGSGGLANPLQATTVSSPLTASGKPVVIYVGAEYCPFCASERWSLIVALSRFGAFSGLTLTRSSSTDVYANTPTFSFRGSTYTSDVVRLSPVETQDRSGNTLDSPDPTQREAFTRYDANGSIPFVSIANRYVAVGSGYPPDVLAGKSWDEIAAALGDPASPIAKAILGNANYLTAAICDLTAQAPASVCDDETLRALARPK